MFAAAAELSPARGVFIQGEVWYLSLGPVSFVIGNERVIHQPALARA